MPMNNRLLRPTTGLDPDAAKYLAAVEAADGEPLEPAVRTAINAFFRDAKDLGVFSALKACCVLAGARTLAGALIPVVGDAPTNVADGFVEGDYSRTAGLTSDGTSYIDSGRASDDDPQNDRHLSVLVTSATTNNRAFIGSIDRNAAPTSANQLYWRLSPQHFLCNASSENFVTTDVYSGDQAFVGITRSSAGTQVARLGNNEYEGSQVSVSPSSLSNYVFARNDTDASFDTCDATIAFYSIGTSLSLEDLDTAVTNLMTAIGNALNVPLDGGGSGANVAPTVTLQPTNETVSTGGTATFTAAASGTPTPTVQWQLSTDSGASWGDIGGANATSYTTPTLTAGDDGNQYRAVWTNSEGTATSNAATLSVTVAVVGSSLWILDAYPPVFHWRT